MPREFRCQLLSTCFQSDQLLLYFSSLCDLKSCSREVRTFDKLKKRFNEDIVLVLRCICPYMNSKFRYIFFGKNTDFLTPKCSSVLRGCKISWTNNIQGALDKKNKIDSQRTFKKDISETLFLSMAP